MKYFIYIILIFLFTLNSCCCYTVTQKERGKVREKIKKYGYRGVTSYFVVTDKGTFEVDYDLYNMIDSGEVYYINVYHIDGTPSNYKSNKELYNN